MWRKILRMVAATCFSWKSPQRNHIAADRVTRTKKGHGTWKWIKRNANRCGVGFYKECIILFLWQLAKPTLLDNGECPFSGYGTKKGQIGVSIDAKGGGTQYFKETCIYFLCNNSMPTRSDKGNLKYEICRKIYEIWKVTYEMRLLESRILLSP